MSNDEDNKSSMPEDADTGLESRLDERSQGDSPSPPPKRRRRENTSAQIRQLQQQINTLVELVTSGNQQPAFQEQVSQDPVDNTFLTVPGEQATKVLELGQCKTEVDERRVLRKTDPERLKELVELQKFGSQDWKEVRYSKTLKEYLAVPGFSELKVNEELCYLDKGRDPICSTERVLAGISNAILDQNQLIRDVLQGIVNWSFNNRDACTPEAVHEVFTQNFGPSSAIFKNSEKMLQIVCGKRASCIDARRERLIAEAPNKQVQGALKKIPPSEEYLFDKSNLSSLIQSLGGPQTWLKTPEQPDQRQSRQKKETQPFSRNSFNSSKSPHHPRVRSESRFQTPKSKDTRRETAKPAKSPSFRKKPTQ